MICRKGRSFHIKEALFGPFLRPNSAIIQPEHALVDIQPNSTTPSMLARPILTAVTASLALTLGGCDAVTALMADPKAAQRIADSKAIGSACRHGLRSIEDCYALNEKASKAAVFDGWKEMDQYMRDNKIEGIASKTEKSEKPAQPVEEIIDEKPSESGGKDKPPGSRPKPKAPPDKAAH